MPLLTNLTPFAAVDFLSMNHKGEEQLVLVVAGTFVLPFPGSTGGKPLRPCNEQPAPATTDVYWGDPATSSLRYEGQAVYTRPMTDVVLHGHAWAPRGRRASSTTVTMRVGPATKQALVFGTRVWQRGAWLSPSSPVPFEAVPLLYERAFGGAAGGDKPSFEPQNPVGMGFYDTARDAVDQPLPYVEDPVAPIRAWSDRPRPCGFGPVARSWQPRLGHAGTYDASWVERRAPLWPDNFNERFFQSAAAGLQLTPHLQGGEPVLLDGFSPDGPISFLLPVQRLVGKCVFSGRSERRRMLLDTVCIEPDERRLLLVWRASFPAHRELAKHIESTVRQLEPWETAP
jgi:hypothetical protein